MPGPSTRCWATPDREVEDMNNRDFAAWCAAATEKIRYGPDRKAVSAELLAHLEDKYDALVVKGVPSEEARARTLEAMGDAREIAPQLGKIHSPWLGYLYSFAKFLGITTGLLAAFFMSVQVWAASGMIFSSDRFDSLPRNVENISFYCKPELSAYVEGYHISIQEAAVGEEDGETRFYFEVQTRWWPWMEKTYVLEAFWAVDSLGNYYYPYDHSSYIHRRVAQGGSSATSGIRNDTMALTQFDADAQWVEICYDRDGRYIVFHIDLTGGDAREQG